MTKSIIILLIALPFLFSCNKDSQQSIVANNTAHYLGTYTTTSGDTAYVSKPNEGVYSKIRWCAMGNSGKLNFDSVVVAMDTSFTVNQLIFYNGSLKPVVGSGQVGTNTIQFHFVIDGNGHINFFGIKKY